MDNLALKKPAIDFKKICDEILKRLNGKTCNDNITGIEIKLRRSLCDMTLQELAEDICSVSYLCKIEQSQIKPNYICLCDICEKLNISKDTLKVLMDLNKVLIDMVGAYFENDEEKLEEIFNKGKGLENYRYKIISFIYYIYKKEFDMALKLSNELRNIVGVLNDIDLYTYAVFYNILNFDLIEAEEIYEELKMISKLNSRENELMNLVDFLIVKCLFKMNSSLLVKKIDELSEEYLKIARFDLIEDIRYVLALYYLFNYEFEGYENIRKVIYLKKYSKNLDIYYKIINKIKVNKKDLLNADSYAYILGLVTIDKTKALELLNQMNDFNNNVEFDTSLVEYLALDSVEEKYNYILLTVLPKLKASKNKIISKFFYNELLLITENTFKYKLFYDFCMEMKA